MFKFLSTKQQQRYTEAGGSATRYAHADSGNDQEWLALPKRDLPELVTRYISKMETEESEAWCNCPWAVHPEDTEIKSGHCRRCGVRRNDSIHEFFDLMYDPESGDMLNHHFKGVRKRRLDNHPQCPVHTREGMVLYFFEWAFTDAARS
jgi:hypothetical protein